jgi:hypothetical protein
VTELPLRKMSTVNDAVPGSVGPGISAVTVRTLRRGSATRCSIARIAAAIVSPP